MKLLPFKKKANPRRSIARPSSGNRPTSVYNYRSSRNQSDRQHDRGNEARPKPPLLARNFVKYAVATLVLLSLGYLTFLTPNATVKLSGQTVISRPNGSYESYVNQYLKGSLLNYSKITFDDDKLFSQIIAQFPEVSDADVSIPFFKQKPHVELKFAEPTVILKVFGDDNYVLDQQGRALARESDAADSVETSRLVSVNDTSDQKVSLGSILLTQQQISFISEIVFQAEQKQLKVEAINLTGGASEINVKYADAAYQVKYSFFAEARQSSGAYFAIRDQLKKDNKTPKQYIDLRIPERAYIK